MGPFLESIYPDFTKYQAKWASADLSCVSVFHKYAFQYPFLWEVRMILTMYQVRHHRFDP